MISVPYKIQFPEIEWSPTPLSPKDYLDQARGPEVVRLSTAEGAEVPLGDLVDPSKPYLFYSHRRRTKVYAQGISTEGGNRTGPVYEIPKDYVGWFETFKDGKSPGCHTTIASIAKSGCRYFLLRSIVAGFKVKGNDPETMEISEECKFYPGEVLKSAGIHTKMWKIAEELEAKSNKEVQQPATQFLLCYDLNGAPIWLPLAHPGKFSVVGDKKTKDPHAVYQIWNIIEREQFPVIVNLAFGWAPRGSSGKFSGKMKLLEVCRPDTLILYNFRDYESIFMELPADANLVIHTALNREELDETDAVKAALDFCRTKVFPFAISMKALDMDYEASVVNNKGHSSVEIRKMACPRDAVNFTRHDIYPPIETDSLAEFWSLSFKEPETLYNTLRLKVANLNLEDPGESTDDSPKGTMRELKGQKDRSKSLAGTTNYAQYLAQMAESRRANDVRASRFADAMKREANC